MQSVIGADGTTPEVAVAVAISAIPNLGLGQHILINQITIR